MNSTEEIAKYQEPKSHYYSPTLTRRTLGYSYDFPEKSPKKDKKWSIGSLFRRKKKGDSESSSEDETQKKGFLGRRKRKPDKRKKPLKLQGTFDHVVIPPGPRNSQIFNGLSHEDSTILSDHTGGFANYVGRALPKTPTYHRENDNKQTLNSRESIVDDINNSRVSIGSGSADSLTRKSRRELAKARAEARRTTTKHNSSSEDESQRSGSSIIQIRSEESLITKQQRDSSASRRSRAARTERYLKRHSRDGENPNNYLRLSKSDAENSIINWKYSDDSNRSPSRSPITPSNNKPNLSYTSLNSQNSSLLGLSTIPPSHGSHSKFRVSNSTSNPSYKPPLSMNEYNNSTKKYSEFNNAPSSLPQDYYFNNQRSVSCDANIHKAPSSELETSEVMHVQFPITRPNSRYRNLSLIDASQINKAHNYRQPPPPPPRDPKRLVTAHYFENGRPNTYYFDNSKSLDKSRSFNVTSPNVDVNKTKKFSSFNLHPSYRSTSEDYLVKEPLQLSTRPSSATPESNKPQRFITRRQQDSSLNPTENFNYLTDKNPRSRKPIFIQNQSEAGNTKKALNFWKQKDQELGKKPESNNPQIFTSQTHVQTKVFLPSVLQNDINNKNGLMDNKIRDTNSPFKPVSPIISKQKSPSPSYIDNIISPPQSFSSSQDMNKSSSPNSTDTQNLETKEELKRKSANLEDALDELEAIYNSLRLGDEDLLERAEQREKDAAAQKLLESKIEPYPGWGISRGALSDSSFSYEPFDTVDSPRRKRIIKKSRTIDRKGDDMAYRKINKDRATTITDPQSVISKVSYLLTSPIYNNNMDDVEDHKTNNKEPDITFDDVVYRNVKHANSTLKVAEPQPPFGIPLGPITPAANSDYLHAVPDNIHRPAFKPRKIPDLVKDDLAFRNLRKDSTKEPALPLVSGEDLKNNNSLENKLDLNSLKKKRAVRSLSANIGSLIQKDVIEKALNKEKFINNNNVSNEYKTLTDIADAMEIARQVLKEKENRISATRKAFMSDTDAGCYVKNLYPTTSTETITESRLNFLNKLRAPSVDDDYKLTGARLGDDLLHSKPPRGLTPDKKLSRSPTKESTPVSKVESTNSSLDDLLTALAEEAKETTERITNELKMLGDKKSEKSSPKKLEEKVLEKDAVSKTLSEIDAVSEHAKLCEKLLECVVDSTDLMSSTKTPVEEVEQINLEPSSVESVANVVLSTSDDQEVQKVEEKVVSESEPDYENLVSDKELNQDEVPTPKTDEIKETKCVSPFEEHKADLIASFQELKQNIEDMEESFPKKPQSKKDSVYDNLEKDYENVEDIKDDDEQTTTGNL